MNVNFSRVISRPFHIQQVPTTDRLTNATKRPREERQSYDESKLGTEARGTFSKADLVSKWIPFGGWTDLAFLT